MHAATSVRGSSEHQGDRRLTYMCTGCDFLVCFSSLYAGKQSGTTAMGGSPVHRSPHRPAAGGDGWQSAFLGSEEHEPGYGRSRSSSRSSMHALDLSNCPPTVSLLLKRQAALWKAGEKKG